MNAKKILVGLIAGAGVSGAALAADDLKSALDESTVNGNIRAYYNTRDYSTRTDEAGFSLGGALRAETGALGPVSFGVGYYTAQDMGTNSSNPAKVNGRLGSDIEVLGEAYAKLSGFDTVLTVGRQKFNTPFANAGDAFIVPFTFEGTSVKNASIENLTLEAGYITTIKNRNSDEFVDVGRWSTGRYGLPGESTEGTVVLGSVYQANGLKVEAWFYEFADLFDTVYLQSDYNFGGTGSIKPFVGIQFASQSETGDELLGAVDSTLYGVQAGAAFGKAKLTLGYNSVAEESGAFKNGAFLAPYSFSTSPLFTNNMLETVENVDAGEAVKLTFNYSFSSQLAFKLSYAEFDFDTITDREATDLDITYSLDDYLKGLSLRWRLEVVTSDVDSVKQTNNRFQVQFAF